MNFANVCCYNKQQIPVEREAMDENSIILFTRYGLGDAPEALRLNLAVKFLTLTLESGRLPAKMVFYTEGVRLACHGSPVVELLQRFESRGVELVLCSTCLDYFHLHKDVAVGVVGGMTDILESLQMAGKVISV